MSRSSPNITPTLADSSASVQKAQSSTCDTCKKNLAKYKCPGCSSQSCSVLCVQSHKTQTKCNGKRNSTDFVRIKDFTDKQMFSDLHFLEEICRESENAKRNIPGINTFRNGRKRGRKDDNVSIQYKKLIKRAEKSEVKLLIGPLGMSKPNPPNSYVDRKSDCLVWRVEWKLDKCTNGCCNDEIMSNAEGYCNETVTREAETNVIGAAYAATLRHGLHGWLDPEKVKVCFRSMTPQSEISRSKVIDQDDTFQSAFRGETIVEYPKIVVCCGGRLDTQHSF